MDASRTKTAEEGARRSPTAYLATAELHFSCVDPNEPRMRRTTGLPEITSPQFSSVHVQAVEAYLAVMRRHGFRGHVGYGTTAKPLESSDA